MSNFAKTISCVLVVLCLVWFALFTAPGRADNCTPNLIARYTEVVISHQECIALGMQCYIIPRDIERFHNNQMQLQECVTRLVERR